MVLTVRSLNIKYQRLRSLSIGLAARSGDQVNCDDAEVVRCKIQEQIGNIAVTEDKVPKSQKVRNFLQLTKAVKTGTQDVHIDPAILFTRLFVLVERSEDRYLKYELTPYPASVFIGDYMRHVNKALLGLAIIDGKKEKPKNGEKSGNMRKQNKWKTKK